MKRAEACVGDYDYEGALGLYEQALQLDATSTEVLDAVGEILLEMGACVCKATLRHDFVKFRVRGI